MNFSQRSRQSAVGPTPRRSNTNAPIPTPGPSRQSAVGTRGTAEAPEYEPPQFTLNPAAQRALAALARAHDLRKLDRTLTEAQEKLAEAAVDLNDKLSARNKSTANARNARAKRQRNGEDHEQDNDGGMAELEKDLENLRGDVTGLTTRIEKNFRGLIQAKRGMKCMNNCLDAAAEDARNDASTQASTLNSGTQRSRRARGTAGGCDADEEAEDEEIADFQPTDPAAGTQPERAPLHVFKKRMEDDETKFQSASLYQKYAQDNDYINFKRAVHDAQYPEDEVPLPPSTEWFNDDGTVAAPGQTRRDNGTGSDDDLVVERAYISTKCPLTLRELVDVVTAVELCDHSFEKSAILELMGRRPAVQCPVGGCRQMLTKKDLKRDPVLVRKIQRLQRNKQTQEDAGDGEDDPVGGTQRNAQSIDEDDDDMGIIANNRGPQPTMKQEPRTTATPGSSVAPRGAQVIDMADEDDDEDQDDQMYD